MKKISKAERLEYWKFLCADFSLEKARGIASHLLKIGYRDRLFYPLLTSLYIFYGRPFKQRKPVRLSTEIIPARFRGLHDTLIVLRDKAFAHVDCDGMPEMGMDDLNRVMVKIEGAIVTCGIASQIPHGLQLQNVIDLCDELLKKCSYHSQRIWQKSMKNWHPVNGEYEVNLDDGYGYLIKELKIREPVIPPDTISRR
jgi:hypothetical protein